MRPCQELGFKEYAESGSREGHAQTAVKKIKLLEVGICRGKSNS